MGNEGKLVPAKVHEIVAQAGELSRLVIDLTDVRFIDSEGLSALIKAHRDIIKRGGQGVELKNAHGAVRKVLAFTRLDKVLFVAEEDEKVKDGERAKEQTSTISRPALNCSFPALKVLIPRAVEFARSYLAEGAIDTDTLDQLDIVLSEAITNAVVHGGEGKEGAQVTLSAEIVGSSVRFVVGDDGAGFDPDGVPEPDFSGEEPGGRGVYIMRSIMDELRYEKSIGGGRNHLFLEKSLVDEEEQE